MSYKPKNFPWKYKQLVTLEDLSKVDLISTQKLCKNTLSFVFRSFKSLKSLGSAVPLRLAGFEMRSYLGKSEE